jgi:hypothetical protein
MTHLRRCWRALATLIAAIAIAWALLYLGERFEWALVREASGQESRAPALMTPPEQEAFLSKAAIVAERRAPGRLYQWRVTLDDGVRRHDAAVETEDGATPSRRNYRFNVAAYELDKLLELRLVAPSVLRTMAGRPAALTWWVDDVAMDERSRREKNIEPPDAERWNQQIQAVRVLDELMSNPYRAMTPDRHGSRSSDDGPERDFLWMELLITRGWRAWLIDHTGTFRLRRQLEHPESLNRCDRALLARLRTLSKETFKHALGKYLSAARLDALDARRALIVKHFDEQIARRGEADVLYDLPR